MNNPLNSSLMELFERLSSLNGLISHLKNQHDNYLPLLKNAFEEQNLDPSIMTGGAALAVRDLTQPANRSRGYHFAGASISRDLDEYQHMLGVVLHRNCNWVVAQSYEAFETFLKDTVAIYVQNNKATIDSTIVKKLTPHGKKERELKNSGYSETDFEYWRAGIASARWNTNKIIIKIKNNFTPSLKKLS